MEYNIKFNEPSLPDYNNLMSRFSEIMLTGQYTNGKYVEQLEKEAAQYLHVKYVIAVNSCTTGLMLVLKALGMEGGYIITPSFSFTATSQAIIWVDNFPLFVDVDPETFNIDPDKVKEALDKNHPEITGILATHVFGNPCYYHALNDLAEAYQVPLIFDAAHAFGSLYAHGVKVGCGGKAEVFSLSPTKVLTSGEGGLIATNDLPLNNILRSMRNYGKAGNTYEVYNQGLNGRMSEFHAAIALAHFPTLDSRLTHRAQLAREYEFHLRSLDMKFQKPVGVPNHSYFAIKTPKRAQIMKDFNKAGIEYRTYFDPPIHTQSLFKYIRGRMGLEQTLFLSKEILNLPMHDCLSLKDVERICYNIKI